MLSALQNKKLKLFFQMLDVNHDGFVGAKDFEIISQNFAKLYDWDIDSSEFDDIQDQFVSLWDGFFALADRDRDNKTSQDEFLENFDRQFESHHGFEAPLFNRFIHTIFDILNVSGTGTITKEEYVRFCLAHDLQAEIAEVGFQKLVRANKDKISKPEFLRDAREFFCSNVPEAAGNWLFVNYQECANTWQALQKSDIKAIALDAPEIRSIADCKEGEGSDFDAIATDAGINAILINESNMVEELPDFARSLANIQTKLEPILLEQIGPIASIHLKYAIKKAVSIPDLIEQLSQSIPSSNREALQISIKDAIDKIMSQTLQELIVAETRKVPAIASEPQISQAFIDRCEEELTEMIGPIAIHILQKTMAVKPNSPKHLVELLAQQLPSQTHAIMFRERVSF